MFKETPVALSESELEILGEWFESDAYKIFKKILIERGNVHAQNSLSAPDWDTIKYIQGKADELKALHNFFKYWHKKQVIKG